MPDPIRAEHQLPLRTGRKSPHQTIYDANEVMVAAGMTPAAAEWLVQAVNDGAHREIERLQRELAASRDRQVNLGKAIDTAGDIIRAALTAGHHHGPDAGMRVLYERAADVEDVDLTDGLPHPDQAAVPG